MPHLRRPLRAVLVMERIAEQVAGPKMQNSTGRLCAGEVEPAHVVHTNPTRARRRVPSRRLVRLPCDRDSVLRDLSGDGICRTLHGKRRRLHLAHRNQPRTGPDWFQPEPVIVASFKDVAPGAQMLVSDDDAIGKPKQLAHLATGDYTVQAVVDRNLGGRQVGVSPGNLYSAPRTVHLGPATDGVVKLLCDRTVSEPTFTDTPRVKGVKLKSKLLSAFYGRPTYMYAAVGLPSDWSSSPNRKYPVLCVAPGFGGDHWGWSGASEIPGGELDGVPFLLVILNPDCPTGYCALADSANNGPWGAALTQELIPYIESTYRGIGEPWARFVTGHSSGGWTSLWLQVANPDFFGGCWSTSPDPVDFRSFQRIDLYAAGANMFTDEKGNPRPIARSGQTVLSTYRAFSDREWGLRGEQLGSFEGVFSPRGPDGEPSRLWDRATGAVDAKVAQAWRKYDIDLKLRTEWATLGPKLKGKLFVICGTEDTFYLDSAVALLRKDLEALGSDATVELLPGDHGSVLTQALYDRIQKGMAAKIRAHQAAAGN